MKEDFLHYIWKFKKIDLLNLKTTNQIPITVCNQGQYLQLSGPDFFNAQLIIGNQKWAGNVEIHIKSSDWYLHNHERDAAYENVILHVVWEHDVAVFRKDNTEIPVLELKNYVDSSLLNNYKALMNKKSWINCENQLIFIDDFLLKNWQERLFFERLERKSKTITDLLSKTSNDWEAVLFALLAKNFGLNTNGNTFMDLALSIPFAVIRKESFELENIEGLLFGLAGLLESDNEDNYPRDLKFRYYFLLHKYKLEKTSLAPMQFFKHRPDNFPTIRLSQLACVYYTHQNLFSKIIQLKSIQEVYDLMQIMTAPYWQDHYQFDRKSPKKVKKLSKNFIDLVIINTIIPVQFAYASSLGQDISARLIDFMAEVAPEKNSIIDTFKLYGFKANSAFESQSLLQLKNEYCNKYRCLECAIGVELLKK